jgi:hypothetical protein
VLSAIESRDTTGAETPEETLFSGFFAPLEPVLDTMDTTVALREIALAEDSDPSTGGADRLRRKHQAMPPEFPVLPCAVSRAGR